MLKNLRRWILLWLGGLIGAALVALFLSFKQVPAELAVSFFGIDTPQQFDMFRKIAALVGLALFVLAGIAKLGVLVQFSRVAQRTGRNWLLWTLMVLFLPLGTVVACLLGIHSGASLARTACGTPSPRCCSLTV